MLILLIGCMLKEMQKNLYVAQIYNQSKAKRKSSKIAKPAASMPERKK